MPIDPTNYDLDERRRTTRAESADTNIRELTARMNENHEATDEMSREEQLKDLLLMESSASDAQLQRPYLTTIPGKYAAEVTLFEWLDYLLGRVGLRQTLDALDYYVRVGWLGEDAAEELRDHVRGFRELTGGAAADDLDAADHVLSLVYIARLAAMS